ncbi:hypothetical protein SmJEL517_g05064 [Synchytrium microbalum]|uniref:SWIRM domain-containing protein n=1 Tax=Synchytrium microbalum TaxID=1806994 RepID=A0A507C2C8_9FUNG|nr:uncharacterized protein SmJEL517_g05064 [Synchytrium microbalum]TPX31663.1 hypothetical protein SmJEL517_g05064 [Synchytrium microbalum]
MDGMDVDGADQKPADADTGNVKYVDQSPHPYANPKPPVPQPHEIIIPSYAAWFKFNDIHTTEVNGVPEFFNNRNKSKTPQIYKDYRDFMINTYRLNPNEYLSLTACRRNLSGDVCAIVRVHAFLEQWGLINYQVDPDSRPSHLAPAFTGHFRVTADTPRGLVPFQPAAPMPRPVGNNSSIINSSNSMAGVTSTSSNITGDVKPLDAGLSTSRNIYDNAGTSSSSPAITPTTATTTNAAKRVKTEDASDERPDIKRVKVNCSTCGVECSRQRFHCVRNPTLDICPNCYTEGRFPSAFYAADFVRLEDKPSDKTTAAKAESWTDKESLLLLEGVEMHDDWNKIAMHVGSKSPEQCLAHFLALPIDEPYLGLSEAGLVLGGPDVKYGGMAGVVSQADNPVLTLATFVSSLVSPSVAKAVADAAVKKLDAKRGINNTDDHDVAMNGTSSNPKLENGTTATSSTNDLSSVAATAIGAAAAKSYSLSNHEEREAARLVFELTSLQMKKMKLKLEVFEKMEEALETERRDLERERQKLFAERQAFKKQQQQAAMNNNGHNMGGHTSSSSSLLGNTTPQMMSAHPGMQALPSMSAMGLPAGSNAVDYNSVVGGGGVGGGYPMVGGVGGTQQQGPAPVSMVTMDADEFNASHGTGMDAYFK